ncbi:Uncharacterised protein [Mannheimia haemolytica]|uniref:Uncharacterized protein n=1 Tax=Mannheimia haemolytica TaxID=75985 RepID=A0A3S5F382_MANHA|nr:hypothetical protein [Mannheimia haemolytica]VEI75307.1 Uncharacterised protein [Mannheimia haemolytica]
MEKPMVSYWKEDTIEIYIDEDGDGDGEQVIILGTYDHKNSGNPQLAIGIIGEIIQTLEGISPLVFFLQKMQQHY